MPDTLSDDPALIAAQIAHDRAALSDSIAKLRSSLSSDALMDEAMQFAKDRIGPVAQSVDTAVRNNPVAAAMVAAGVAWLILGRKQKPAPSSEALAGTRYEAMTRWEDEGGPAAPLPEPDDAWATETDSLRRRATALLSDIDAAARLKLRPAADLARERAAVVADLAAATARAMASGLEQLSGAARDQIIAARHRAYAAHVAAMRKGASLVEEHPLIAGAIALAAGAVVAKALPVTEAENRILGPERDRLLDEARALLAQERARLTSAATAA